MSYFDTDINLGKLGEEELSRWCTSAGLVSNRSLEEDKTGWDHFIEFPYLKSTLPRDKLELPIECKIQVKSTFRRDKAVNIKLSVLKRLVDYTSPAFILFYEYTNKDSPTLESTYLVHVDQQLISRVLKKIRQNDLKSTPSNLYDLQLKISYNKKHKLLENSGKTLRDTILGLVPKGLGDYQQNKHKITKSVGYETSGFELQFEAFPEALDKYFLDNALGLKTSFDITNVVTRDTRFNLEGIETSKSDIATIEVLRKTNKKCKLRFKLSQYAPALTFDGEVFSIPSLIEKDTRLCFKTSLFTLEVKGFTKGNKLNFDIHLTADNSVTLDDSLKFLKLFSSDYSNTSFILEIDLGKESSSFLGTMTWSTEFGQPS